MSPRTISPSVYRHDACELGEGPFWHDQELWWVDIEKGFLHSADARGNSRRSVSFGQRIGAATPAGDRFMLVALEREIAQLDLTTGDRKTVARPNDLPEGSRFNDGKCDAHGRWVIGTLSMPGHLRTSALYSLNPDYSLRRLRGAVSISNGLAWSAQGETMYYVDTPTRCVFAYDYDLDTGSISRERVILQFSESDGWPDGMTIDREGRLWVGFWDGWAVRCYHPQTGVCEALISVPCARPTSCCFGGVDLNMMFITTAQVGLDERALREQPLAGCIFVCEPGASGFATASFASPSSDAQG
jgi:sugar lactone lactonase YvrE